MNNFPSTPSIGRPETKPTPQPFQDGLTPANTNLSLDSRFRENSAALIGSFAVSTILAAGAGALLWKNHRVIGGLIGGLVVGPAVGIGIGSLIVLRNTAK